MTNNTAPQGQNNPMGSDATKHDAVERVKDDLSWRYAGEDRDFDDDDIHTVLELIETQSAEIEFDPVNYRNWKLEHQLDCGHPMFETREMMDEREVRGPLDNGIDVGIHAVDWDSGIIPAQIEKTKAELVEMDRDFLTDLMLGLGNCLRISNPRVVVCHCAKCGGK
ncbi:hypothetical protein [Thalassospira aquimaris]|uniref:Uncharacterized protein n=1 Tax=Thalassospira aquimaris TaxID=3037796 RepID=A0ABT6GGF4_9PROT|nr:hypothetical protein [Thalassospira sp. FZY0004]MDG4721171.1 hypothetical protein [Thalassospira sp. FZY0004]